MTRRFQSVRDGVRWILALAILAGVQAGCQEVLFKKDATRTQFETHDRLRQRYVPLEQENVFGEPEPALRARLSPNG